jgi:DNA polymerase-3 subunit beta
MENNMKIEAKALKKALSLSSSVINARSPSSILQCVLISSADGNALVHATTTETSSVYSIPSEGSGKFAIPVKQLATICSNAGDEDITITEGNNGANIKVGRASFKLPTEDPAKFPVNNVEMFDKCSVPSDVLKQAIERTIYAVDIGSGRYALEGVRFASEDSQLVLEAFDGNRFSIAYTSAECERMEALVPANAVGVIRHILSDETAYIASTENAIRVTCGPCKVTANLLNGKFPKLRNALKYTKDCVFSSYNRDDMLLAVKQASVVCSEESKGIELRAKDGVLSFKAGSDGREFVTEIDSVNQGDDFEVKVSSQYLMQILSPLDDVVQMVVNQGYTFIRQEGFEAGIAGMKQTEVAQ